MSDDIQNFLDSLFIKEKRDSMNADEMAKQFDEMTEKQQQIIINTISDEMKKKTCELFDNISMFKC